MDCKHGRVKTSCWECAFDKEVKKLPKFMRDTEDARKYLLLFWLAAQKAANNGGPDDL